MRNIAVPFAIITFRANLALNPAQGTEAALTGRLILARVMHPLTPVEQRGKRAVIASLQLTDSSQRVPPDHRSQGKGLDHPCLLAIETINQ